MIKTIYIGLVPQEYLNMGTDDLFQHGENYYYYKLEFDLADGCATLTDTCGRFMPLDMTNYGEIAYALQKVEEFQEGYNDLEDEMASFMADVPSVMRTIVSDDE